MFKIILITAIIMISFWGYSWYMGKVAPSVVDSTKVNKGEAVAYFAGGCFWCVESDYEKLPEVKSVVSGYMGGDLESPSYEQVSSGKSGHREVVKVVYDPTKTNYRDLVWHLMRHIDPTDEGGSFYDRGYQYTSAIYYQTDEERVIAEKVIKDLEEKMVFKKAITTSIELAGKFWLADKYHQDYYKKNPVQYKRYRKGSGRDLFIESVWGDMKDSWGGYKKPSDAKLKDLLTDLQYRVTQQEGTERAFDNKYWDNHEEGLYVDIVSGEPLFSSTEKFDSGTGWPSFLRPINKDVVTERTDYKLIFPRTEIRRRYADSQLGHIILDGPVENDKVRYCMNSAALRFIKKEDLKEKGYGKYLALFKKS